MAWRPHGRASVDRKNPRAWAICDDCGFLYNRHDLQWQFEWYGNKLQNTRFLKCQQCLDVPQEQLRVIVLPADPEPIQDPRPERVNSSDPVSVLNISFNPLNNTSVIGTMTQGAGLKAAFDSNVNKPFFLCAATFVSNAGFLTNYIGKNWTGLTTNNVGINATGFTAAAPRDSKFWAGGSTAWAFQGSNEAVFWNTIDSGFTAGTIGEVITSNKSLSPFLYHRFALSGDGIYSVSVAQLEIFVKAAPVAAVTVPITNPAPVLQVLLGADGDILLGPDGEILLGEGG